MPKLKTNRGAAKRFRATASGFKARRAFRNHILTKKATKRKRQIRSNLHVGQSDIASICRMIPSALGKSAKRRRVYKAKAANLEHGSLSIAVNEGE